MNDMYSICAFIHPDKLIGVVFELMIWPIVLFFKLMKEIDSD